MNTKATKQQSARADAAKPLSVKQGALKLKAACEYLGGISATSVRRLIKRRLLKPNHALRHIILPIAELDRFLAGQATTSHRETGKEQAVGLVPLVNPPINTGGAVND